MNIKHLIAITIASPAIAAIPFVNPTFEDGLTGWTTWSTVPTLTSESPYDTSGLSFLVGTSSGVMQTHTLDAGLYSITASARGFGEVELWFKEVAAPVPEYVYAGGWFSSNGWKEETYTFSVTFPGEVEIWFQKKSGSASLFDIKPIGVPEPVGLAVFGVIGLAYANRRKR